MSASEASTKHTCTADGRPLPFGRKAPKGECPRCDELHDGAPARSGWQKDYFERKNRHDAERSAAIRNHTNDNCPYMQRNAHGYWAGVCVCFDW